MRQRWKLALVILATLLVAGLLTLRVDEMSGPAFWKWGTRQLAFLRTYLALLAAAVPFALAQVLERRNRKVGILLLMLAVLTLELTALGIGKDPFSLDRMPEFIRRPLYTSYFKDAETVAELRPWLREFPERLATFRVHSQNKPPGPILFFALCRRLAPNENNENRAAWLGGLAIAVLATLAVPATYLMTRRLTRDPDAAFAAASCMALSPGLLLFLPCLDQLFPVLAALLIVLWHRALGGSNAAAAGFGLALAGTLLITYNLLVLGIFLGLLTLSHLGRGAARRVGIALAALVGVYVLFYGATGYDPVASFRAALRNQSRLAEIWQRPYPQTVPWDLYDFLLGTGWLGGLLAAFYLFSRARQVEPERWRLALCALVQIAGVAATGLLRTETARVWLFLQPLLFLAAGLELRGWSWRQRQVVYFGLWLLMATTCRNLRFL